MINYKGIPDNLNDRLRFIREKNGYTQKEIADKLFVKRNQYTMYETGARTISIEYVIKLAKLYSLSSDFILGLSANPEYINYGDFSVGLNDEAISNLQFMFNEHRTSFQGMSKLLESRFVHRFAAWLGVLMKMPKDICASDFKCEEDVAEMIMHLYREDSETEFPFNIFGLTEMESMEYGRIDFETIAEININTYLNKIIEEVRNEPITRKRFAGELYNKYRVEAEQEIEEIKKSENEFDGRVE